MLGGTGGHQGAVTLTSQNMPSHFSEVDTDHCLKQDFMSSAPRNDLVRKNEALQVTQAKGHEKGETVTSQKLRISCALGQWL